MGGPGRTRSTDLDLGPLSAGERAQLVGVGRTLARPVPLLGPVLVPARIELVDVNGEPHLRYWTARVGRKPVPLGLLDNFLGLRSDDPGEILRFAQKWGVLETCTHGRHCSHAAACHGGGPTRDEP